MIPTLSTLPGYSKDLEQNAWADYIELLCLTSKDGEISLSDVMGNVLQEEAESLQRGSGASGKKEDYCARQLRDIFEYLKSRAFLLDEYYPFGFVDDDTICVDLENLSLGEKLYLFLLFCSNLKYFSQKERPDLTREFETVSRGVLRKILPNFVVEIFGTASESETPFHGGCLLERFKKLAECLHTEVKTAVQRNPRYARACGDGGMDLVGYIDLDPPSAGAPFVPMCFAQCACSVEEWVQKQDSIKYDEWDQKFEQIAHYCEMIFVPFSLRGSDGKWNASREDRIVVIPIDRIRFFNIVKMNNNDLSFFKESKAESVVNVSLDELRK